MYTNGTSRTLGKQGGGLGWRRRRTLSLFWGSLLKIHYLPVTPGRLLGTVTGSKLRSTVQLCDLGRALQGCSLHLK